MTFLLDEDYDDLPDDGSEAFVRLEGISRHRLSMVSRDRDDNLPYDEIMRYMNKVTALASHFEIPNIDYHLDPIGLVLVLCRSPISLSHLGPERERADAAQI